MTHQDLGLPVERDFSPGINVLTALRRQRLGWLAALSEVIDNSLDADATTIAIEIGRRRFRIADNGVGCQDLISMIRLGDHKAHASTSLGRYGVGLKDAALWLWGVLEISTISNGRFRRMRIDWDMVRQFKCPDWERQATEALARDYGVPLPSGTVIQITGFDRDRRTPESLVDDLSHRFSPALRQGVAISLNIHGKRTTLIPPPLPPLEAEIERECSVDGKSYRLRAGIVPGDESNPSPGFNVCYAHRVIREIPTSPRFFAWVDLSDDWILSTHKDDVEDSEALRRDLEQECEVLLEKARDYSAVAKLDQLAGHLTGLIGKAVKDTPDIKEKRNKGDEHGRHARKETDRAQKRIHLHQVGTRVLRIPRGGGPQIEFDKKGPEFGIGYVRCDGLDYVYLNDDDPLVSQYRKSDSLIELGTLAIGLYAQYISAQDDVEFATRRFPSMKSEEAEDQYREIMSRWARIVAEDGSAALSLRSAS